MTKHRPSPRKAAKDSEKIFLVGSPNVGKSALFNALTNSYVTVSNYPGTTVGVFAGKMRVGSHHQFAVMDTPGMYSLKPITAEEDVTRKLILEEKPDLIIHVADAKNLDRMLPLTFQLIEIGRPVILVLNLFDELLARGMKIDIAHLEHDLGIPVVETVAINGTGVGNLSSRIVEVIEGRYKFGEAPHTYTADMEKRIQDVGALLDGGYTLPKRAIALLALQEDPAVLDQVRKDPRCEDILAHLKVKSGQSLAYRLSRERQEMANDILAEHMMVAARRRTGRWKETLSNIMIHPVWGLPILALVLWFGLYKFVGEFGAGFLVDFIETDIFEARINPHVDTFFHKFFGAGVFFNLFGGEYGIITLGLRYAIAIIFPIVATFFIAFSIIEDTGYLPRLAMLVDRVFKVFGLSGRAVIPITLGFGCDTMATIVTRTLESKKERIIATFLLSLAIPCSAQLGVLLGLLAGHPKMLIAWAATISLVFALAGILAKMLIKGDDTTFFMELPPLRLPFFVNVVSKTYARMFWYFQEVLPIFILASVLIWLGKLTGIFDVLVGLMSYPVRWSGMPEAAGETFLYGFFRRDFGAAGLFDMAKDGRLSGNALLIAAVVLTLFVPCIAQFAVVWKERGKAMAVGMAAFIFPFSFFVGFLLTAFLNAFAIQL